MRSVDTSAHHVPVAPSVLRNRLLARTRLRQLQLVLLIAERGSIQRAAADAGMSQPSATKALSELERLVGTALFERHARGMRPTPVCRELLPLVRSMLAALNRCAEALAAAAEGAQGMIAVGSITGAIAGVLGRGLPAFLAQHPQLRVEVVEGAHPVLVGALAEQSLDLVLVRQPDVIAGGMRFVPLRQDRIVAVAAPGHRLLGRRELRAEQLLDELWALPPLDAMMHGVFERLFAPCGRQPARAPLVTRSQPMLLDFLRAQPALVLTPYSSVQTFLEAGLLKVLPLRCDDVLPPIGMLLPEHPAKRGASLLAEHLAAAAPPGLG